MSVTAVARTRLALRDALGEARAAWSRTATAGVAIAAVVALAPFLLAGAVATDSLASGAYAALAATGLAICVGLGGVPSVAQGAFVGTGAFAAAHLLRHTQLPAELCAVAGAVAAAALGTAAGFAVRSLDPVRVAVSTWLLSWLVALALEGLPWLSGGSQGLVVPTRRLFGFHPTPLVHYELAVVLTGLCALALVALKRAPFGVDLAAAAAHPGAAAALGVPAARLRVGAFAASAFVGGLAGGFAVQLDIVADPTAYGPLLSFELLVAVLVGGATAALGPSAGVAVLGLISLAARGLGDLGAVSSARFQPMLEALLVLAVLATGGSALVPAVRARLGRYLPRRPRTAEPGARAAPRRATLTARGLTKRFGGVVAADDVSLKLEPGTITALVGPNGSGKTTILRLLGGTLAPDAGTIAVDRNDVTEAAADRRVQAGLVRTLQTRTVFAGLTVLDSALVGANRTRRYGGALRALVSTPLHRLESRESERAAATALAAVGLGNGTDRPADVLAGSARQRLMLAAALATEPAVLLLDEPSAGASRDERHELARLLRRLREDGLAILLVEHDLTLVRAVADEVVELDGGRIVRQGRD